MYGVACQGGQWLVKKVFYWNGTFSYNGAGELDKDIDTDPSDVANYTMYSE